MAEEVQLGPAIQGSARADTKAESATFELELQGVPSEGWRAEFTSLLAGGANVTFERRAPGRPAMALRVVCGSPSAVAEVVRLLTRVVGETNAAMQRREEKRNADRNEQSAKRSELERAVNAELAKLA
ncbi:MAG: hypothetical protein EOO73_29665 [Myxococcales bacterium]|nr:MAG: hypothetical protein EOO73_29665 [Myxococcales bacterium]